MINSFGEMYKDNASQIITSLLFSYLYEAQMKSHLIQTRICLMKSFCFLEDVLFISLFIYFAQVIC